MDFFQQQNLLPKLNLSDFKILNCKINPLKIGRGKSAIEFKIQFDSKRNYQRQQALSKSIVAKWRTDGRGKPSLRS
jgi:hypothetical protein